MKRPPDPDEMVTITVPRAALTVVAPRPATVTQRNCLDLFGISKADYLRMAAKKRFAVRVEGQLRIARYEDVAAYLAGSEKSPPAEDLAPTSRRAPKRRLDPAAYLAKAGARPR